MGDRFFGHTDSQARKRPDAFASLAFTALSALVNITWGTLLLRTRGVKLGRCDAG